MSSHATDTLSTGGRLVSLTDGREYELKDRALVIGRDTGCDIVIAGRQISRRHAEIIPTPRGYILNDTSSNGTLLNGQPVEERRLLASGDVIACGTHQIRFVAAGSSDAPGGAPPGAEHRLSNTMHGIPTVAPPGAAKPRAGAPQHPPPGAAQRLNQTVHGIPSVPPVGDAARHRLSNTMHGIPAAPPRLATFVGRSGPLAGRRFPVYVPVANIGRAEYNDIVLPDGSVSTAHAKLQRREGIWVLVDLDSTNGTSVDGHRVTGEAPLSPGAVVLIGDVELLFEPTDDGVEAPPAGGTRISRSLDDHLPGHGKSSER